MHPVREGRALPVWRRQPGAVVLPNVRRPPIARKKSRRRPAGTGDGLGDYRISEGVAPLTPRSVVHPDVGVAQELQDQESVRRTDAALSVRDDFLVRGHAVRLEQLA